MVPLRVHMLSIDYQNYQIQKKIKVINKVINNNNTAEQHGSP